MRFNTARYQRYVFQNFQIAFLKFCERTRGIAKLLHCLVVLQSSSKWKLTRDSIYLKMYETWWSSIGSILQ
jgi:hypothetical protein